MKITENVPMVVYDNRCYLCVKFAKFVNCCSRGKVTMVGHYSDIGMQVRNEVLDESALEMFWFIDNKRAYGGRAALLPLIKSFFSRKLKNSPTIKFNDICTEDCKTIKAVFLRSSSLLTNSKKIDL